MGVEYERKFKLNFPTFLALSAAFPQNTREIQMETVYYDTPSEALSSRHYTLRRRLENGISVCTLKTPADGLGRHEWELEADSIQAAIPELCKLSGLEELTALTAEGVIAVCGVRFTRLACPVDLGIATAELALDKGILFGGGRELPFAEVEVELKSGIETAVFGWAHALAARFGLKPEPRSKFRRALTLAKGD